MATDELIIYRRRLPHWREADAAYFVTWRLAPGQSELLPDERDIVVAAFRHFDSQRYNLISYVVMSDHVHVIVTPVEGYDLTAIVQSWKSYTANRLQRSRGRKGQIWQREYFDRIIRDDQELTDRLAYIAGNPNKRWPDVQSYWWVWVYGD